MVEVEDTGIGFTRSRADDGSGPPPSSGRPGTGLGLAIVRAVVEGHGGALTVVPDRPRGSLLRIVLLAHPPAAAPGAAPVGAPGQRYRRGTRPGESG
ncbi:ATP-binding protein [Streptomyces caeni]|uniref:histidine kinase n=1 Tax=Streptomyces caeni TaxID=2307231 RepID=A0ABW4IWS0_9ACTN